MILYLASTSPRRSALLREAEISFVPVEPGEEPADPGVPESVARARALDKALGARIDAAAAPGLVLGVDTVVDLDGEELGKPRDAEHATAMLARLAGREHRVHTGIALVAWPGRDVVAAEVETATVVFDPLDGEAIARHVALALHAGKAGAYGIQDPPTAAFARVVRGGIDTVIGLPVARLRALLEEVASRGRGG